MPTRDTGDSLVNTRQCGRAARALLVNCGALLATLACLGAHAEQPRILVIDAPGAGTQAFQGTGCFGFSDCSVLLNDEGTLTGYYLDDQNVFHGFVRSSEGKFTLFDAPGADLKAQDFNGTLPNAINEEGSIAGLYYDANNLGHGFLRSRAGKFTTFDVPGGIAGTTNAIALNEDGASVGYFQSASGVFQGFLRRPDGTFATWSGPGSCTATSVPHCYGTGAFGINAAGTVSGGYEDNSGNLVDHGLIRSRHGKLTSYEAADAGTGLYQGTGSPGSSVPINRSGSTTGTTIDSNGVVHGYLREPSGAITSFDVPGAGPLGIGCYNDCAAGLNDSGTITGSYLDANNVYHGFVRSPEGKFTTFDAPGANTTAGAYSGTFPVSINEEGAVTGYFLDINNVNHAFLRLAPHHED